MSSLIDKSPAWCAEIKEFGELAKVEDTELELLRQAVMQLRDNQFAMTASDWAISRGEMMVGVRADPTSESLDFRRDRLVNRYSTKPPFTIRYLQTRLDSLVGEGVAVAQVDEQNFVLKVTMGIPSALYFGEIAHTIQAVKPANLIYIQATSLMDRIGITEHIWKQPINRITRLSSSWKLGRTAFAKAEKEVQLK